jgi:glycosyltransferase involved in cell wall biosynthesis
LVRLITRHHFDVVHTHSFKGGLLNRLAARLAGIPAIVHTFHGVPFDTSTNGWKTRLCFLSERLQCLLCNRLVSVGEVLRQELIDHSVARPGKIVTIRSSVDFSTLRGVAPGGIRSEAGVPPDAPLVGFVGRLAPQKAPEVLVRAFACVKQSISNAHLMIVGEGPLRPTVENEARQLGVDDSLHLLGERQDVPRLLAAMDVFALPSRWEGVGRALTEAMYMKLPVVCTGVNGVPELVKHGLTGRLATGTSENIAQSMAENIITVLKNPRHAQQLGAAAHRQVKHVMSASTMVQDIVKLYTKLAASDNTQASISHQGGNCVRHMRQAEFR